MMRFVFSLDLTGPEDSTRLQRLEDHETIRKGSLGALYSFKNLNPLYYNLAQGSKGSIPRGRRCYETAFEVVLEKRGWLLPRNFVGRELKTTGSERQEKLYSTYWV